LENIKIIVALRSARTALGWTQQEFADNMQISKTTIARIETMEVSPRADFLMNALRLFRESGVQVDLLDAEKVVVTIEKTALDEAQNRLSNEQMRRSDRKLVPAKDVAKLKTFLNKSGMAKVYEAARVAKNAESAEKKK
jgi:transcriptional regulator with XRE-family HTH domain